MFGIGTKPRPGGLGVLGSPMTPSILRPTTVVESLFKRFGSKWPYYKKHYTHLFWPGGRWKYGQSDKAQWLYRRSGGDLDPGAGYSRPSAKSVLHNGDLHEYEIGQLDPSGYLESGATQRVEIPDGFQLKYQIVHTAGQTDVQGGTTAGKAQENAATDSHAYIEQNISHTGGDKCYIEAYVKRGVGSRHAGIRVYNGADDIYNFVNLDTLAMDSGDSGNGSLDSATATQVGDWVRITLLGVPDSGGGNNTNDVALFASTDGLFANRSYAGDNSSELIWSHVTVVTGTDQIQSYIAGGDTIVRSADALNWYDPTGFGAIALKGTLFFVARIPKMEYLTSDGALLSLNYNNANNDASGGSVAFRLHDSNHVIRCVIWEGSDLQGGDDYTTLGDPGPDTTVAVAVAWDDATRTKIGVADRVVEFTETNDDTPLDLDRLSLNTVPNVWTSKSAQILFLCTFDECFTASQMQQLTGATEAISYLESTAGL